MQGLVQSRLPSWQDPPARSRRRSNGEMAAAALFLRLDRSCSGFIYESQIRPIWAALANYVQEGNASMFLRQLRERTAPISRAEWTSIMEALQSIVGDRLFRTLMRGAETLLAELECAALEFRCRSGQLDAIEWQAGPGSGSQKVRALSKPSEPGRQSQASKEERVGAADEPHSQQQTRDAGEPAPGVASSVAGDVRAGDATDVEGEARIPVEAVAAEKAAASAEASVVEAASVEPSVAEAASAEGAQAPAAEAAKASVVAESSSASAEGATAPTATEAGEEKKATASEVGAVSADKEVREAKPQQTPAGDAAPTHDQSVSSSSAGHVQQPLSGKGQPSTKASAQDAQPQPQSQLPVPRPRPSNTGPKQVRKPKAEPKAAPGRRDIGINTDPVLEGRLGVHGPSSVTSNTGPKQSRKGRGELTKELAKASTPSRTASNSRNASKSEADQPVGDAKTSADAAPPPREAAPPPERATVPARQAMPTGSKQQPLVPVPPPQLRAPRPPDASSSSSRPAAMENRGWSRSMSEPGPGGFKQSVLNERLPSLLPVSGGKSSKDAGASGDSKGPSADTKRLSASKRPSGDTKRPGDTKSPSGDINRLSSDSKSSVGEPTMPAGETKGPSEKRVESTLALSKTADSASSYKDLRARLDDERKELQKQRQQVRDLERLLSDASRKEKPHFGITNSVAYRTPVVPDPQVRHPVRKLMVLPHPEKDSSITPGAGTTNASKELEPLRSSQIDTLDTERLQLAAHEDKKAVAASRREQSRLRTQAIMHLGADGHDTWELRKMEKASKLEDLGTFSEAMWGSFFEWKADLETDVA